GRRDGRRPGNGGGKKHFAGKPDGERGPKPQGERPAAAQPNGQRKPDGFKRFKGNNKRRFGGKRPANRAA
ncbi:hypothetical protein EOD07_32940, partial [Mesorhizobium sp. M2C.T.Ca.TU.002.02.1.1]